MGVVNKLYKCGVKTKNIILISNLRWWDLGSIQVKLEPLYHDVDNYALKWIYNDKKGIYVVDTNRIDHIEAKDYDLYLIENNYQEKLLQEHIDNCEDEKMLFYLNRVPKTHLSAEQANSFLIENMGQNSQYYYIHQSDYNFKEEEK